MSAYVHSYAHKKQATMHLKMGGDMQRKLGPTAEGKGQMSGKRGVAQEALGMMVTTVSKQTLCLQ